MPDWERHDAIDMASDRMTEMELEIDRLRTALGISIETCALLRAELAEAQEEDGE